MKLEDKIRNLIKDAVRNINNSITEEEIPAIHLELPKEKQHGDLATNIAMQLASRLKLSPQEIAAKLAEFMKEGLKDASLDRNIAKIEVKGPGFINFFLSSDSLYDVLAEIRKKKSGFGKPAAGPLQSGGKIHIEFVSANPTGSLSVAHGRQAAVGDSLTNILKFAGDTVVKEYYINDDGNQIRLLGESLKARVLELLGEAVEFPEDGYKGSYVLDIAREVIAKFGSKAKDKSLSFFSAYATRCILNMIKKDLKDFGVRFDSWFSQKKFASTGEIERTLNVLKERQFIYEKDGALWFKSTAFGDDKDRVVVKSNGEFTYIAPDIAYHKEKLKRGFDRLIDIWGPDHHGYIPRLKASIQALGYTKDTLSVLIIQLATLYRDGKPVPMSTRAGEFITLKEVMEEVGPDATRFFFLMRKRDSHLDFDLELAKKESMDNPVYYIQYAYARISSILKFEEEKKVKGKRTGVDLSLLNTPEEIELIKILRKFPEIIAICVHEMEPYRITLYLQELAGAFHGFYNKHRVVSDDLRLSSARLALVECVQIVLGNGLRLLGVSAPEEM